MKECKHFSTVYPYCLACKIETLEQKLHIAEEEIKSLKDALYNAGEQICGEICFKESCDPSIDNKGIMEIAMGELAEKDVHSRNHGYINKILNKGNYSHHSYSWPQEISRSDLKNRGGGEMNNQLDEGYEKLSYCQQRHDYGCDNEHGTFEACNNGLKFVEEKVKRLEQKLRIATEALEVYADKNKWYGESSFSADLSFCHSDIERGYEPAAEAIRRIGEVGNG